MLNQGIWKHPAKMVCLFSLAPPVLKIVSGSWGICLNRLNQLPPDLIADIALVLLKEVDGAVLAGLINETMEVARKFHTGSALISILSKAASRSERDCSSAFCAALAKAYLNRISMVS